MDESETDTDHAAQLDAGMNASEYRAVWINRLLAGDWVPDKPDKEANGGFGKEPDNGRPVPYRLNGHVKIERGLPWEPSN